MFRTFLPESNIPKEMKTRFYKNVSKIIGHIKQENSPDHPLVYHYTDGNALLGIVKNKSLWATHIGFLNDTEEFRDAVRLFVQQIKLRALCTESNLAADFAIKLLAERANENIPLSQISPWFVACFSKRKNDLPQWRNYSAGESKYSLGMELNHIGALALHLGQPKGDHYPYLIYLVPVIYQKQKKEKAINDLIDFIVDQYPRDEKETSPKDRNKFAQDWLRSFIMAATLVAPVFKHNSFEHEEEWRLIIRPQFCDILYRNRSSLLTPYIEINLEAISYISGDNEWSNPIRECWIGPSPHKEANAFSAKNLLEANGFKGIQMPESEIPYREL